MRSLAVLFVALLACVARPLAAQEIAYEPVADGMLETGLVVGPGGGSERSIFLSESPTPQGVAAYGPFRVLDAQRAALVDVTDHRSPAAFAAMLRDHPGIGLLEMVECPGTEDDRANLKLGRMIRAAGIATYVPAGGSVRSGGVELFLAGARRFADPRAEFAVHAWMDEDGLEATDYAAGAQENRKYLAYYRQMGMSAGEAAAFYAMTNSVPHDEARWLTGVQMAGWVRLERPAG